MVTCTLEWSYDTVAASFMLEQCVNDRHGCNFAVVQTIDGHARVYTVVGLDKNKRYCWRISTGATVSNQVCS